MFQVIPQSDTRCLVIRFSYMVKIYFLFVFSPSSMTYEDTHNTLKYANRAKNIKASVSTSACIMLTHKIILENRDLARTLPSCFLDRQNFVGRIFNCVSFGLKPYLTLANHPL